MALADCCRVIRLLAQKYIPNPMLPDGFKFDLRLYVVLNSFSPMEAFIYEVHTSSPTSIITRARPQAHPRARAPE